MAFSQDYIDSVGQKYGIPTDIWRGVIATESGYNPYARPQGSSAYGYTQLLKGTAADLGVDRFDLAQNLDGGARYLAQQYQTFGSWPLALGAYNQGPGTIQREGFTDKAKSYANKVFKNAGKKAEDFAKKTLSKSAEYAARSVLAGMTGGASEAAIAAGKAFDVNPLDLGGGVMNMMPGNDCGLICQLRKWLEETSFFTRLAIGIVAIIMLIGGLFLFGKGEAQRIVDVAKGAVK